MNINNDVMLLVEGEYHIPSDMTIKRVGNKLMVYKKKSKTLSENEYRCKDCIHNVSGCSIGYWQTKVCEMKPKKPRKDGVMLYKSTRKYDKPCENFKLKT